MISRMLLISLIALPGCSRYTTTDVPYAKADMRRKNFGSVLGDNLIMVAPPTKTTRTTVTGECAVNKYLWNGAIETIGFMPIKQAIPQQGKIITDWYIAEDRPDVRVRVTVGIIGKELRADAVRLWIDREKRNPYKKTWSEYRVSPEERTRLEILIVERARKLRNNQMQKSAPTAN